VQSVIITTKVVSSNPVNGEVYSIQRYVIKFVTQLLAIGLWFSPGTPVSSTNKTDRHKITEILLKVVLDTINQSNNYFNTHTACLEHRTYLEMFFSGLDGYVLFNIILWNIYFSTSSFYP